MNYEEIEDIINRVDGLLNRKKETKFLFDLASNLEPPYNNILEIGSYKGLSSLCLSFGAINSKGNVFCLDFFKYFSDWQKNILENNLKNTFPIIGNANKILEQINILNLGLVFIDSSHSYEDCKIQLGFVASKSKNNFMVAFHDYGHKDYPGVETYCREIQEQEILINSNIFCSICYGVINVEKYRSLHNIFSF